MKLINRFQKFMYGRYGIDNLSRFFLGEYIILLILNIFVEHIFITILKFLLVIIIFYRLLSKNIYSRNKENQKFLKIKKKLLKPFKNIKRNIKDKDHIYKKCHKCKKTLKLPLPSKKGIKYAKCPHCGKRVKIVALKHQKVEFIK